MTPMDSPADGRAARAWLMRQARGQRAHLLRPVMLGLAGTACALAFAFLVARLLATLLGFASGGGWADLALAAAFALLAAILSTMQERAQLAAGEAARARLRRDAFSRLLEAGPLDARGLGAKSALVVDRVEAVDGFFARWLPAAVLAILSPLAVLLAVAWFDWVSALVLLVMGLLVPVAMAVTGIGAAREARRQMEALDRLGSRFLDRLRGLSTLVQFNRAEAEAQALGAAAAEFRARTLRVLRVAFLSSTALEFLAAGTLAYLAWRHGALLGARHEAPAAALFCILAVPTFFAPLRAFSAAYHEAQSAAGAAGELRALLEAPARPGLALDAVPPRVALAVTDLSWRPDPARPPAIQRITFAVAPGETLLLMGPSGSGKTSILRLLMGFARPDSGRIAINGQDALRLAPAELRRAIAFVGQRPHLFAGTLRDNILLARPDATPAQVERAAEAARVSAFAAGLPQGLDTPVGEGGFGLSGGQAQRVALARAFLRDAPLILLDEPTAYLDPATEAELVEAIGRLVAGRTAVIATHSPAFRAISARVMEVGHVG